MLKEIKIDSGSDNILSSLHGDILDVIRLLEFIYKTVNSSTNF